MLFFSALNDIPTPSQTHTHTQAFRHTSTFLCTKRGSDVFSCQQEWQGRRLSGWKQWQLHSAITWNINKNPFTMTSRWDVPLFLLSRHMPLGLPIIPSAIRGSHTHTHTAVQDESSGLHTLYRQGICDIIWNSHTHTHSLVWGNVVKCISVH